MISRRVLPALVQDCPDSARVVVADQLARSTLLADNLRVKSKVHPKYKTKYHGGNWPEYEQALVRRGDVTRHTPPRSVAPVVICPWLTEWQAEKTAIALRLFVHHGVPR